ncbi:GNAT family N-acetyltransferase [Natronococcus jeotgali]|uniref:N-acetyltransferase GCN5 n=1 Tax=Natronococcus jeotgali DSM 18795 TaxID=1227498 RepID=L9XSI7_9EURY|nr:GNAT family N-acetyltransferase [Natronococcus jeotgali]ELY64769.1 N-acetyltransferase GCN5 [Natronococcus jeotgali DSM 18795]
MEIRPAATNDRESLRRIARETWHDTYDELSEETIDETIDDWYGDEELERALSEPGTAVLVAEADGEVVGFTHGVVQGEEGDVLRMYVHPDRQREGIGTALHERLREDLEDFNMSLMRAIDLASNEGGRAFYEGLGFERTGDGEVEIGGESRREVVYTLEL